jgi:hypothetical protein
MLDGLARRRPRPRAEGTERASAAERDLGEAGQAGAKAAA